MTVEAFLPFAFHPAPGIGGSVCESAWGPGPVRYGLILPAQTSEAEAHRLLREYIEGRLTTDH